MLTSTRIWDWVSHCLSQHSTRGSRTSHSVTVMRHGLLQLEIGYSHAQVGILVFLLLCGYSPNGVCQSWGHTASACILSVLRKEKGYRLVFQESKSTQGFTCSLIFENWGLSKYLEALSWNAKTEQQDFLASGAGRGKFGWLVGYYLLGINTERVYAKAEGTMPSSQNKKTLTANWHTRNCKLYCKNTC